MKTQKLKVGDWVEVRSKEEILRTLDEQGRLDGMPFMPEMFAFCGRDSRFTSEHTRPATRSFRSGDGGLKDTVHLETRCDGQAHGGCQAGCLLFWKEAWLKPVDVACWTNSCSAHRRY